MGLRRKLDKDDLNLLEIIEDPIWFGEFLRSTGDASDDETERKRAKAFKYTWYQKDILSDKNKYIVFIAGRSVGKCSPYYSKIYTYEYGYETIAKLRDKKSFSVYALNKDGKFVQRRAKIGVNGTRDVYKITTESGYEFTGTANHPILTPDGWIEIERLNIDSHMAAIATHLPHENQQNQFGWHEMRWLGYILGCGRLAPQIPIKIKRTSQLLELKAIAKHFDANIKKEGDGSFRLVRKKGPLKSYMAYLLNEAGFKYDNKNIIRYIPDLIKREKLDSIKILLESFLSTYAEINNQEVTLLHPMKEFILDLQELFLRFNVEFIYEKVISEEWRGKEVYKLKTRSYTDYYNLFSHFKIPGVTVNNLPEPAREDHYHGNYRFEKIKSIALDRKIMTYAIQVYEDHNYISDGLVVHNSLLFEDKIIHESLNTDIYFPETKEQLLATANLTQLNPIMSRLISRFMNSPLLRDFIKSGNINRSRGTMEFPIPGSSLPYTFISRIAGKTGESNMVKFSHV